MRRIIICLLLFLLLLTPIFAVTRNQVKRVSFAYGETFRIGFSSSDMTGHTEQPSNPLTTVNLSPSQAGGTLKYVTPRFYIYCQVFIPERVSIKVLEASPLGGEYDWTAVSYTVGSLGNIESSDSSWEAFEEEVSVSNSRPRVYSWEYRVEVPATSALPENENLTGNLTIEVSVI